MNSEISIRSKFTFFSLVIGEGIFLSAIAIIALIMLIFSSHIDIGTVISQRLLANQDHTNGIVLSLSNSIASNWKPEGAIRSLKTDMRGYDFSVAGTSALTFDNLNNGTTLSLFVTQYSNAVNARERFSIQSQWIFDFDYGVPPSQQLYSYEDQKFITNPVPDSQDNHFGCKSIYQYKKLTETICGGIFLYKTYTIFVNTYTVRQGVTYLSQENLEEIFLRINGIMASK